MVVFDMLAFSYSETAVAYLLELFPNQVFVVRGNSRLTVPAFSRKFGRICDLFSVDGDHKEKNAFADIKNSVTAVRPGGLILLDDMNHFSKQRTRRAFDTAISEGLLRHPLCIENVSIPVPRTHRFDHEPRNARFLRSSWCLARVPGSVPSSRLTELHHPNDEVSLPPEDFFLAETLL